MDTDPEIIALFSKDTGKGLPPLTREEEHRLILAHQRGDKSATDAMIRHNVGLVVSIAERYKGHGVPVADLVQEGCSLGLVRALDKFDVRTGYAFSTYATHWIHHAVQRTIDNECSTIRVPVHYRERARRIRGVAQRLGQELGREPTVEEIAEEFGVSGEVVSEILTRTRPAKSLDEPLGADDDRTLEGLVPSGFPAIEEEVIERVARERARKQIREIIKTSTHLADNERAVLRQRYLGREVRTLDQVARRRGVTRERVRQIEKAAIAKLGEHHVEELKELLRLIA